MIYSPENIDPKLDLVLERIVDVPPELVWKAWTEPEHLVKWFTPAPWKTIDCEIELYPGGKFFTVMQSPEGEEMPNTGCYLEVVKNRKLVWTDAMQPGFRPAAEPNGCFERYFTAIVSMEPHEQGTQYRAIALHANEADRKTHEEMGFHDGWGTVATQLEAYAKSLM